MRTPKLKRRVSNATLNRLRELRRKHGLGEFAGGNPFRKRNGRSKGKSKRRTSSYGDNKLGL